MAEDRKPLADELGIPFYGQLMGMATGTEKDLYDAAYISRQYGLESEFKDEDRTSDSLRHILLLFSSVLRPIQAQNDVVHQFQ